MDQNQWFNTGSPAPMNDRQAFEAGWTACYEAFFQANVTTEAIGVAQLSFAIGGDTLPESTMVRQITTANAFDSITISDLISVNCCDFDRLTVTNTGAVPVVISTNPLLYIKRVS